ncbi:MAG TPA: hypothetical protein ENK43_04160 [Planctomycetes bacterium]|nr:hypothetical protein [Planctomycetota bacterium]
MTLDALDSLRGHDGAKRLLRAVQTTGRIPTGFLFHGHVGVGKRTAARIFLRRLVCDAGTGCGTCLPCRMDLEERHPDLLEVARAEGKTRLVIDQIRDLREWFSVTPFFADRRAAVIDDASTMTEEAQNALLKLLEEPPARGLIILVADDPGKLLETIRSRLQTVYFGPLREKDLLNLADPEGSLPSTHRSLLALWAGGSVERAGRLLEEGRLDEAIARSRALLDRKVGPFSFSQDLLGGRVAGRDQREEVRELLEGSLLLLRAELRARYGGDVPDVLLMEELGARDDAVIEEAQVLLLEGLGRLGGQATPRLLLEGLKIRLHRLWHGSRSRGGVPRTV